MRVLKILSSFLGGILVLALIVGFVGREVVLSVTVNKVRAAVRTLRTAEIPPAFVQSCLEYGGPPVGAEPLVRNQLRFTSKRDYVLESVCHNTPSLREVFEEGQLLPFIERGVGQSGLTDSQSGHGLTFSVLGRTGVVYQEEVGVHGSLRYAGEPALELTAGPGTVCSGYGFTCCSEVSQVGQGEQRTEALDCPRTCYASCTARPVVLHFSAEAAFFVDARVVQTQSGQPVRFSYAISDLDSDPWGDAFASSSTLIERLEKALSALRPTQESDTLKSITIAFGDGEVAEVSDLQGVVEHTYTCTRALCVYNATLQATTTLGTTSRLTDNGRLQVHVQP